MTDISVIIPTCNRPQYLNRTLATFVHQSTDLTYEIIVVDDYCRDGRTADVVNFWSKKKEIRYFRSCDYGIKNGRTCIRNLGIKKARGLILIFLDDDMIVPPNFIQQHYSSHVGKSQKNVVIGYRNHLKVSQQFLDFINPVSLIGNPPAMERLPAIKDEREGIYRTCQGDLSRLPTPWIFLFSNNFSVSRRFLIGIGGLFNDSFQGAWGGEDIELGYRLFRAGGKFKLNRKAVGYHQWHYANWRENIRSLKTNMEKIFYLHPSMETELYADYVDIGLGNFIGDIRRYFSINGNFPKTLWDKDQCSNEIYARLKERADGNNLIIGAGDGDILHRIPFKACVDMRGEVVKRGISKYPNLSWHCMVGIHLTYPDGYFDNVIINDFLILLTPYHRRMLFSEALRVARGSIWYGTEKRILFEPMLQDPGELDYFNALEKVSGVSIKEKINANVFTVGQQCLFQIKRGRLSSFAGKGKPKLVIITDSNMNNTNCDNAIELALSLASKADVALELEDYKSESIIQMGGQFHSRRLTKNENETILSCLNRDLRGIKEQFPRLSFTGNVHYFGKRIEWITNKPPGVLPSHFVHFLNEQVDSIWCPGQASADYLKASGTDESKLKIIPIGVNKSLTDYSKEKRIGGKPTFKFIAIGTIEKAWGLDIVLDAFCGAFKRIANASLEIGILPLKQRDILKKEGLHNRTARLDHGKYAERANALANYRIDNWKSIARKKGLGADRVKFKYLGEGIRLWPSYFKDADCYVQAHRADFVGQRVIQAMGLGLPVITTSRYLPLELKGRGMNYLLQSKEGSAAEIEWSSDVVYSCWAEPNFDQLVRLLRYVYLNRSEARARGMKAREFVLDNLTWDRISQRIINDLKTLNGREKVKNPKSMELTALFRDLKKKGLISIEEESYERR